MKSKVFSNILVLAISFGGAAFCARLLYLDIYINKTTIDGLSEAGFIKEKHETVKRKFGENMLWDLVNKNEKLYWNDSIQTANKSQATIKLNDGNEIKLGAASLVVLEKDNDQLSLNLKSGQLFLASKNSNSKVKVNGVVLDNEQGETLSLNIDTQLGQLTAVQTSSDGTGKQIIINKDGSKNEKPLPAVLESPVALFRKTTDSDFENINFKWNTKDPKTKIEIAYDKDFKHLFAEASGEKTTFVTKLKPGFYFWRVIGAEGISSEERSFSIIKMQPPTLISPTKQDRFAYKNDIPIVEFIWSGASDSSNYIFEASTDKDFNKVFVREETTKTNFRTAQLQQGEVFWRVYAIYENNRKPSSVSKIELEKLKEPTPPQLQLPENKIEISADLMANNNGLRFKWDSQDKTAFKFVMSSTIGFEKELYSAETTQTAFILKQPLQPGTYYWAVGYKNLDGNWIFKDKRILNIVQAKILDAPSFDMEEVQ